MGKDHEQIGGAFPTTHWSLVCRAGQDDQQAKRDALDQLLACSLPAMRAHLVYAKRLAPADADDVVQDFVAEKILQRDLLGRADQRLGRFRTYLLTALDRFLLNRIRDAGAKNRAPAGAARITMGDHDDLPAAGQDASDAFDLAWARSVIQETLQRMRSHCEASGRGRIWEVFNCRVVAPALEGAPPVEYQDLVARFGFCSPAEAANVLVTAKRMYARALKSVIAQYARDTEEIESEVRQLHAVLAGS